MKKLRCKPCVRVKLRSTQPVRTAELPSDDTHAPVERVYIAVTSEYAALYANDVYSLIADVQGGMGRLLTGLNHALVILVRSLHTLSARGGVHLAASC